MSLRVSEQLAACMSELAAESHQAVQSRKPEKAAEVKQSVESLVVSMQTPLLIPYCFPGDLTVLLAHLRAPQPFSEPAVMKLLGWSLHEHVSEYLRPTLFFFFKCQQFNLLFGFLLAVLEEVNFSYGQESDLPQNGIYISPASLCASED